jgi:hypothetical protein
MKQLGFGIALVFALHLAIVLVGLWLDPSTSFPGP